MTAEPLTAEPLTAEPVTREPVTREALHNAGFAQARFNIEAMRSAGPTSPIVWIDVELVTLRPWSADRRPNQAVIEGAERAYRDAGLRVGFYSFPTGWAEIVCGWRLPNHPVWTTVATAARTRAPAWLAWHRQPGQGRSRPLPLGQFGHGATVADHSA